MALVLGFGALLWLKIDPTQELVPEDEGRIAEELLRNLKKSLAGAKPSRLGAT